ncbi:MAG: tyrosine-type recombinase/integrase [Eisenbergiella sp.]
MRMEIEKGNIVTKTVNGMRSIPAPKWVIDEITIKRAWFEHQKLFVSDLQDMGYICCHCNGKPFHRNSFTEDFHILTNMCGLREIHWHDLRHMYASVLKHNEVNMKAISEFLGHHSPDFTEDIYVYQEETVFDCSILSEVWDGIRLENGPELGIEELFVPLTDADCMLYLT